jgi:hypothetical protein
MRYLSPKAAPGHGLPVSGYQTAGASPCSLPAPPSGPKLELRLLQSPQTIPGRHRIDPQCARSFAATQSPSCSFSDYRPAQDSLPRATLRSRLEHRIGHSNRDRNQVKRYPGALRQAMCMSHSGIRMRGMMPGSTTVGESVYRLYKGSGAFHLSYATVMRT